MAIAPYILKLYLSEDYYIWIGSDFTDATFTVGKNSLTCDSLFDVFARSGTSGDLTYSVSGQMITFNKNIQGLGSDFNTVTVSIGSIIQGDYPNTPIYYVIQAQESKTAFDLSTLNLSEGKHTVTVAASAGSYRDSDASNSVIYTEPAQGFTLTLNYGLNSDASLQAHERVKIGSTPASNDDYDYQSVSGSIENKAGTDLGETVTINNVTKYYTWTAWSNGSTDWQTAVERTDPSYTLVYIMNCLTCDTLILMSDGTEKRIDTLRFGEKVLSYNPETDELEEDEVTYSDSDMHKQHDNFDMWIFDDGTIIKTVHRHRFYNVERNAMIYMDEWKIGEHARRKDGVIVTLVSHENIKETVKHYTIFTKNQNYFANGLLSGNRYTKPIVFGSKFGIAKEREKK